MMSIILLWLFTLLCSVPSLTGQNFQTKWTFSSRTFYLVNLVSVHLGSLRDTSHILLLSLDDLAQDKNTCRVTSSNKKVFNPLLPQISSSCGLLVEPELFKQMALRFQARDIWPLLKTSATRICEGKQLLIYGYMTWFVIQIFKK